MSDTCGECAAPLRPGGGWCEACGSRRPGAVPRPWIVEVTADRSWFDQVGMSDVVFPAAYPTRRFVLREGESSIGRRSERRGVEPDLDLGGAPEDPAVSRLHAVLRVDAGGACELVDLGSTNGTYVDGAPEPIEQGVAVRLRDGTTLRLGAWTSITVHQDDDAPSGPDC